MSESENKIEKQIIYNGTLVYPKNGDDREMKESEASLSLSINHEKEELLVVYGTAQITIPICLIFQYQIDSIEEGGFKIIICSHSFQKLLIDCHLPDPTLLNEATLCKQIISNFQYPSVHETKQLSSSRLSCHPPNFSQPTLDSNKGTLDDDCDNKSSCWRISDINESFEICPTYPQTIVIPSTISDSVLKHASKFRSKQRLPIHSFHLSNGTALFRSSQPLSGLGRAKSKQDEHLINAIRTQSPSSKMLIVDARPLQSSLANAVTGGGSISLENYPECEKCHLGIENIHKIRQSFMSRLDGDVEGWAEDWKRLMKGVGEIVETMEKGIAVLVHCSDGWDRTSQLVSLVQLIMDPFARTIQGFCELIEREWTLAGHQFQSRLANNLALNEISHNNSSFIHRMTIQMKSSPSHASDQFCPIFTQFLDAVAVLMDLCEKVDEEAVIDGEIIDGNRGGKTSPFEFNTDLLKTILFECFKGRFINFMGNCEKNRLTTEAFSSLPCVWNYIGDKKDMFKNPNYCPNNGVIEFDDKKYNQKEWSY